MAAANARSSLSFSDDPDISALLLEWPMESG
jgi:hypothetical protein